MSVETTKQIPFPFCDFAAYFSEEEWMALLEWQKELYRNVMKEIHQALLSLGPLIAATVVSLGATGTEQPCPFGNPDTERREKSVADFDVPPETNQEETQNPLMMEGSKKTFCHGTNDKKVYCHNPDPILRLEEESRVLVNHHEVNGKENCTVLNTEQSDFKSMHSQTFEPIQKSYVKQEPNAEERIVGCQTMNSVNVSKVEEESSLIYHPNAEGDESCSFWYVKVKEVVSPYPNEAESYSLNYSDHEESESSKSPSLTGQGALTSIFPLGIKEEIQVFSMDHTESERKGTPSSTEELGAITSPVSFIVEEGLDTHSMKNEASDTRDNNPSPVDDGIVIRKWKYRDFVKSTEIIASNKAFSIKNKSKVTRTSEKHVYHGSKIPLQRKWKLRSDITPQHECVSSNATTLNLHQSKIKNRTAEKYNKKKRNEKIPKRRTHKVKKTHNCGQYICVECSKSFSLKGNLIRHQRTHERESARPYQCTECTKSFIQKGHLLGHLRTHTGEKPYQCSECQRSFSLKQNLYRHKFKHMGVRPNQSIDCEKNFNFKGSLNEHQKTHTEKNSKNQKQQKGILKGYSKNRFRRPLQTQFTN